MDLARFFAPLYVDRWLHHSQRRSQGLMVMMSNWLCLTETFSLSNARTSRLRKVLAESNFLITFTLKIFKFEYRCYWIFTKFAPQCEETGKLDSKASLVIRSFFSKFLFRLPFSDGKIRRVFHVLFSVVCSMHGRLKIMCISLFFFHWIFRKSCMAVHRHSLRFSSRHTSRLLSTCGSFIGLLAHIFHRWFHTARCFFSYQLFAQHAVSEQRNECWPRNQMHDFSIRNCPFDCSRNVAFYSMQFTFYFFLKRVLNISFHHLSVPWMVRRLFSLCGSCASFRRLIFRIYSLSNGNSRVSDSGGVYANHWMLNTESKVIFRSSFDNALWWRVEVKVYDVGGGVMTQQRQPHTSQSSNASRSLASLIADHWHTM